MMNCALGGLCAISVTGPVLIESSGTYTYSVTQRGSNVPVSYQWQVTPDAQVVGSSAGSSVSVLLTQGTEQTYPSISVTAVDQGSGRALTRSITPVVREGGSNCGPLIAC